MRRLLVRYGLAVAALVLVAFLVPLALLARSLASERAIDAGRADAQGVAAFTGSASDDPARLEAALLAVNTGARRTTVYRADGTQRGAPAPLSDAVRLALTGRALTARTTGGVEVLVPVGGPDGITVVRTFVPDAQLRAGVARSWLILAGVGVVVLVATAVTGDRLARRLTRSVQDLATVAERLGAGDLGARVEVSGPPELVSVGHVLNGLGARVERLLADERELVADLSHRLRTPITALRLDVGLLADPQERAQLAGHVDDLVAGLDAVLRAAREPRDRPTPTADAAAVVRQRAAFWGVLATDQARRLDLDAPDEPAPVALDPAELGAAVDALVDNVFTHTPPHTAFRLVVHRADQAVLVTIEDDGPGLSTPELAGRGASSAGSTGLGLDVARRVAERAGGDLVVGTGRHGGARITLRLPALTQP